ncbi:MAG: sporulation protein [Spirochaetota bacterium]|nr:sporulation protein [Spirochaetota bacterium]
MGLMKNIKKVFNIGGIEITVDIHNESIRQGDEIRGKVIIWGGDYEQSGDSILLELKEYWTETRGTGNTRRTVTVYRERETVSLAGDFSVMPGFENTYSFSVTLPLNSRISNSSEGWCLVVTLDIPKAIDPYDMVKLDVSPARDLEAIVRSCENKLRFKEQSDYRDWYKSDSSVYFRLIPPDDLKDKLDYLAFKLYLTADGDVRGSITYNLQEKSLGDYFKALLGMDNVKKPFEIKKARLRDDSGKLNEDSVLELINPDIQKIIN